MIINKVYRWAKKKDLEAELAAGLAGGLVMGLVWGLAGGLVMGLVMGLAGGLVMGLVWGLAGGLAAGLVIGLVWGLATFPFMNFPENLIMVLLILALSELLFLFDKRQPRKENRFWFTAKVKGEALLESVIIFFNCYVLYRVDWKGVYEAVSGSSDTIW